MAEQEANQERVEFYRTVDEAKALVASVPDVPVTFLDLLGRWTATTTVAGAPT